MEDYANKIYSAWREKRLMEKEGLLLSADQAYEIQNRIRIMKGMSVMGYKISMTNKETQSWFNASEPRYGILSEEHFISGKLNLSDMNSPLIEVELAFVAKEDIDPDKKINEIMAGFEIAPAFEIPDSRYSDWFPKISLTELTIDNAVAGKVCIGERIGIKDASSLRAIASTLYFNGEVIDRGLASEVLGDPINAIEWIVGKLCIRNETIKKGMAILSGSIMKPSQLKTGVYLADFEGVGKITISVL